MFFYTKIKVAFFHNVTLIFIHTPTLHFLQFFPDRLAYSQTNLNTHLKNLTHKTHKTPINKGFNPSHPISPYHPHFYTYIIPLPYPYHISLIPLL